MLRPYVHTLGDLWAVGYLRQADEAGCADATDRSLAVESLAD